MRRTLWMALIVGGLSGLVLGSTLRFPEAVARRRARKSSGFTRSGSSRTTPANA